MILLPDIRLNTAVLSIQQPYTLNGYLVTRIECRFVDYSYNREYHIYNEDNDVMIYRQSDFAYHFYHCMGKFIQQYSPHVQVPGGYNVNWNNFSFDDYIQGIEEQCERLQHSYSYYSQVMKEQLDSQGRLISRLWHTHATLSSYRPNAINSPYSIQGNLQSNTISANNTLSPETTKSTTKNIIHVHNYKPKYIPYYMPNENKDTTLLLGAEIEVDCGGKSEEHAKNVLEIICDKSNDSDKEESIITIPTVRILEKNEKCSLKDGCLIETISITGIKDGLPVTESYDLFCHPPKLHCVVNENNELVFLGDNESDLDDVMVKYDRKVTQITYQANEDKMYCTHDGSLRAGIEFDTMPMSLEYHKNNMKYKEMFEYLTQNGYKAHDTDTAGLHIHADRKYLGKTSLMQQLTISKILYILEKFNDEICVIARRDNAYSRFVGKEEVNKNLNELYNKYKSTGKKVALNLLHENTIEFRCFRGTLKYETFILTLEFVQDIIDFAKATNIEEIELIQWEDLMNTFSDELKEYYLNRLKKKQKENNPKDSTSSSPSPTSPVDISGQNLLQMHIDRVTSTTLSDLTGCSVINADALSIPNEARRYIRENISLPNSTVLPMLIPNTGHETMSSSTFETIINEWGRIMDIQSTKTPEEQLKEKIKTIKKRLKNNNNYIECKKLQTELNKLQKELKKEKKKKGTQ